jgi:4-hydroxybenzoate polyprenyltransferase
MSRRSETLSKLADIGFLARPPLLCASCTFFFAGVVAAAGLSGPQQILIVPLRILPNLALFMLIVSAAFVINQVFDVESDSANRKTFILTSGVVTRGESLGFLALVTGLAILFSFRAGGIERYMVWIGLALGFAYSVPPVRLKARPIADLLANVGGFGLIGFGLGWLAVAGPGVELVLRATPYCLAMAAIFLNTCIPDESGDRVVGDRTSCVVFGRQAVSRTALVLLVASAAVAVLVGDSLCALAAFGSIPAAVAVAVDPTSRNSVIGSQFAARLLFVLISVRSPMLALLGVVCYVGSRIYYGRRFGLKYPNLTGARAR